MKPALAAVCSAVLALTALAGCGEKSEPSLDSLKTQYRQQEEQAVVGDYEGTLRQKGQKPFKVTASVVSLKSSARNVVHYTGIDCSGTWIYQTRNGTAYVFREKIDRGASKQCKGAGTVTLTPLGANQYRYEFSGGGVKSTGTLERTA
jgi:hypothetical protein